MSRHVDPDDLMARTHAAGARLRDRADLLSTALADVLYELAAAVLLEADAPKPRHVASLGRLVGQVERAMASPGLADVATAAHAGAQAMALLADAANGADPTGGEYPALG